MYLAATPQGQLIALKVMLEHLTVKEESRAAFLKEGRTASLLNANLVEVYDAGEADGRPWISMELVRGWSLSALLKKLRANGERLDQDEAAELIRQAALGLHFAHEVKGRDGEPLGLVHRDVSPQNIMVGENGVAKVVDFGLAKATAVSDTVTTTIKGKLRYMPPEQLKSQKLDRRADVFALGAVLWELACGAPLYPGASEAEVFQQALYTPQPHPDEVAKGLTRSMVAVLQATTSRELEKRTASARDLAEALAELSSPQAREKLGAHVARFFERLPKTLEEARGKDAGSGPTLAAGMPLEAFAAAATFAPPRPKKAAAGVLAPPPKAVKYVAEAPSLTLKRQDPRERRTDQLDPPSSVVPTELVAANAPEPTNPDAATVAPSPTHPDMRAPPVPEQAVSDPSMRALSPLLEPDTVAMATGPQQTVIDALPLEPPTEALKAPSRRAAIIAVVSALGLVALGGLVGWLTRSASPEVNGDAPFVEAPAPAEDAVEAPVVDGGAANRASPLAKRKLGRVEIESNVPAVVREKNVDLGVTPFARGFTPGRHRLSVATPDGQASAEIDLVVRPGETARRSVRLSPR
ncbi:MAG: protein kinase [Archangiaceae bacterium]|nr:protein kinase [Archangiaceae bacterium]